MSANYRLKFVKAFPGIRIPGMPGMWYRCNSCGRWCARPGRENAFIPDYMKMEVDHILPWSLGGTDTLDNLQPLCKPCNRLKGNSMDIIDMNIAMYNSARRGKQFKIKKRRKSRGRSKTGN